MIKILSNIGWLLGEKIIRIGLVFFVEAWVARYLGPENFGLLSYVIAFFALFSVFGTLGFDNIAIRDIVQNPVDKERILGTSLALRLIGAMFAIVGALLAISYLKPGDTLTFGLLAVIAPAMIFKAFDSIDYWFQSQLQSRYTVFSISASLMIGAVVKVVLILINAPLMAFAAVVTLEFFFIAIGFVIFYAASGQSILSWRVDLSTARALFGESWPLIFSGMAVIIYMKVDQIMLGEMLGASEVGIYSAAAKLSEGFYFIPIIIASSTFPSLVRSKIHDEDIYQARMQQLYDIMVWIALAVAIPTVFFSPSLVRLVYGSAYEQAYPILSIHILASVFVFLGVARTKWLINEGLIKFSLFTNSIGAVVNVGMNLYLIPRYGGVGAAVSTVVSYWAAVHLSCFFYPDTRVAGKMLTKAIFVPVRAVINRRFI